MFFNQLQFYIGEKERKDEAQVKKLEEISKHIFEKPIITPESNTKTEK